PTLPITAFPVENNYPEFINGKPTKSYIDWFSTTFVFSLFGVPALSVPAGLSSENLPIGLQIIGPHFSENRLISLAQIVEEKFSLTLPEIEPL
ncbi:MAG: amidase family protein, partial [Pseudomonadota bacterium]|nr:amidase family protein [Pseudomonadota bacterium]